MKSAEHTTVGVVGASARAAVHSLLRAGYNAWAVDLFGDRDLQMVAPCAVCPLDEYPASLPRLAAQFPPGAVLYTGGLENHPTVVAELAASHKLWGNPLSVLEAVRDPRWLFPAIENVLRWPAFADGGIVLPALVPRGEPCPSAGRWLRKPLRSGGGLGIRFAAPGEPASPTHIFQEVVDGTPMSALFISDPDEPEWNRRARLDCVTEQIIGESWLHAAQFAYCGNIGPIDFSHKLRSAVWSVALGLVPETQLRGVWGLDFVLKDDTVYPLEVNPRYTAAIEVLEYGARCSALWSHGECFTGTRALWKRKGTQRVDTPIGKAIYYAPHDLTFPVSGPWDADLALPFDPWRLPAFADIPAAGAVVPAGQPVLTLFASGSSAAECRGRLQSRARELDLLFAEHAT
jgi:predicted ATP-grasp superfamily ATP-dependent carboligase